MQEAAELSSPMRGLPRYLFLLELLVCFGPISLMALASVIIIGPSVSVVLGKLLGSSASFGDLPWLAALEPLFLSFGGLVGLFALQEVSRSVLKGRRKLVYPSTAIKWMALAGVAAIVVIGLQVVPDEPTARFTVFCVYLPLLSSAHLTVLAWRLLFPKEA